MDGLSSFYRYGLSPKGNQKKWYEGEVFVKEDKFDGESLAEYLVSLFLEASNCPIPFIRYRLRSRNVVLAENYKPRYSYIPFAKLLDIKIKQYSWYDRIVASNGNLFNYWDKVVWSKLSAPERANYVVSLFEISVSALVMPFYI